VVAGVEGTRRPAVVIPHWLHETVEGTMRGGGVVDDGQGLEVAMVGRGRHGGVARQEGHAFRDCAGPAQFVVVGDCS
jgi:hypothetical protein